MTTSPPRPPVAAAGRRGAAGGVVASWIRLVTHTLVGLLQIPLLFRHVPSSELAIWYLLFTTATFVSLSDLGLPATFGRAVSYLWGRDTAGAGDRGPELPAAYREVRLSDLYAAGLAGTFCLALAFAALTLPAALLYLSTSPAAGDATSYLLPLALFLAGAVLNLVAAIPMAGLSGHGDVTWDNGLRTAVTLAGFAALYLVVPAHPSLTALTAIYLAQGALLAAASHVALVRRHPAVTLRGARLDPKLVVAMYRESAPIFVSRLGLWFTQESTLLIAGHFLGPQHVADFAVLRQVVATGSAVTAAVPIAVSPHAAAAHAAGDDLQVRSLYLASLRYALVLNVLWTVGLLLWAPEVLRALVGRGLLVGYAVFAPLALGSLLELHGMTHGFFVWAVGRWPFAPHLLAGGVLNVVFASYGCARFGLPGLAWGSVLSQAVTVYWVPVVHGLRAIGVAPRAYLVATLWPALGYAAALAAAGAAVKAAFAPFVAAGAAPDRLVAGVYVAAGIVVTCLLAGILAWLIALTPADKEYFGRLARLRR